MAGEEVTIQTEVVAAIAQLGVPMDKAVAAYIIVAKAVIARCKREYQRALAADRQARWRARERDGPVTHPSRVRNASVTHPKSQVVVPSQLTATSVTPTSLWEGKRGEGGCWDGRATETERTRTQHPPFSLAGPDQNKRKPNQARAVQQQGPPGFIRFWSAWPSGDRKVNRKGCLVKWKARSLEAIADKIVSAVEGWKASQSWIDGYIPMPLTWINQDRWNEVPDRADGCRDMSIEEADRLLGVSHA